MFFIGERPGAGQTMKLCNNFLSAAAMAATSEAMVMGVKAGLDPRIMLDVINAGTGRNTATEDKFARVVLPRTFNLGFTVGLMTKDLKLCLSEGKALGVPMHGGRGGHAAVADRLRRERAGQGSHHRRAAGRAPRRRRGARAARKAALPTCMRQVGIRARICAARFTIRLRGSTEARGRS